MPAFNAPLSLETETRIVALLARGDEQKSIAQETGVNQNTVGRVKLRNKENLEIIKQQLLVKAAEDADSIKQKANTKLSRKLDRDDKVVEIIDKAHEDYLEGEISIKEYSEILRKVKELSVGELVQVSKEMHNQTTAIEKPPATQADLAYLAAAIASGDEVKITQAVFNGQPQHPTE